MVGSSMITITRDRVETVVADLVRIESINPTLVPGGSGETAIARYAADFLVRAGLKANVIEIGPGRANTVGLLQGRAPGKTLMFNGHLDTVGVAGMEDPFSARIQNGLLYGRGAEDMKGGVAAMLVAAETLAREGLPNGALMVAAVADEELESAGTRAILEDLEKRRTLPRCDAAIVTEPTALRVVTAHKGFGWAEIHTEGRAAHGSRPEEGCDAIVFMGRVLGEIERLNSRLAKTPGHPLLGHGSIHASLIAGGQELSSYPAECRLSLERRFIPDEDVLTLDNELREIITRLAARDSRFRARHSLGYTASALETPRDSAIAQTLLRSARRAIGPDVPFGVQSFWTDAALLSEAGIPSVLFGPGGAGLHSKVEYVRLDDVVKCAETLVECARDFCSS